MALCSAHSEVTSLTALSTACLLVAHLFELGVRRIYLSSFSTVGSGWEGPLDKEATHRHTHPCKWHGLPELPMLHIRSKAGKQSSARSVQTTSAAAAPYTHNLPPTLPSPCKNMKNATVCKSPAKGPLPAPPSPFTRLIAALCSIG